MDTEGSLEKLTPEISIILTTVGNCIGLKGMDITRDKLDVLIKFSHVIWSFICRFQKEEGSKQILQDYIGTVCKEKRLPNYLINNIITTQHQDFVEKARSRDIAGMTTELVELFSNVVNYEVGSSDFFKLIAESGVQRSQSYVMKKAPSLEDVLPAEIDDSISGITGVISVTPDPVVVNDVSEVAEVVEVAKITEPEVVLVVSAEDVNVDVNVDVVEPIQDGTAGSVSDVISDTTSEVITCVVNDDVDVDDNVDDVYALPEEVSEVIQIAEDTSLPPVQAYSTVHIESEECPYAICDEESPHVSVVGMSSAMSTLAPAIRERIRTSKIVIIMIN